jgi:hypothetical protein
LKSGSRRITDDSLTAQSNRREFLPLEELDSSESVPMFSKGFFTIGVIVEKTGVTTTKSGKDICRFRVSDLQKYDMSKVKPALVSQFKQDALGMKAALKAYNSSAYKVYTFLVFG